MLSHNCAREPVVSAYIHARAFATSHTRILLIHSYMRSYTRTNMHVLYIIVMETQFDLSPCAPGFAPLNAPPPPTKIAQNRPWSHLT